MKPQELLAGTPLEQDEQLFGAPWEARAFAIAHRMTELGLFTWDEFRDFLIDEIGKADRARESGTAPDAGAAHEARSGDAYYTHFLNALEKLLEKKGIVVACDLEARMAEISTPADDHGN